MEKLLSLKELASVLGISLSSAYKLAQSGRIPCVKIGSNYRFSPTAVEKWIQSGNEISAR